MFEAETEQGEEVLLEVVDSPTGESEDGLETRMKALEEEELQLSDERLAGLPWLYIQKVIDKSYQSYLSSDIRSNMR